LESIPGFAAADGADADTMNYAFGIQKVGNLNSKYQVYKNPYMTENTILLGLKVHNSWKQVQHLLHTFH
jgi:hypothetical protein